MSYKIHEGLRINTNDIFGFIQRLEAVIQHTFLETICQEVAQMTVNRIDSGDVHENGGPLRYFEKCWDDGLDDFFDFDFEVSLGKTEDGTILAAPYYGVLTRQRYKEAVLALPEVDSFGYWDNADEDDSVSATEWAERKRQWTSIFEKDDGNVLLLSYKRSAVSKNPFRDFFYRLVSQDGVKERLVKAQPSPLERVRQKCIATLNLDNSRNEQMKLSQAISFEETKRIAVSYPRLLQFEDFVQKQDCAQPLGLDEEILSAVVVAIADRIGIELTYR